MGFSTHLKSLVPQYFPTINLWHHVMFMVQTMWHMLCTKLHLIVIVAFASKAK